MKVHPPPTRPFGAHLAARGGLAGAVREAHRVGATALQAFTSSPQMWKARPVAAEAAAEFRLARDEWGDHPVVVHDSYLINLAAATEEAREKSYAALVAEFERCALYGVEMVNSHMGAHVGQGATEGIRLVGAATRRLLAETDPSVSLLMETTAGAGSCLGGSFEEIAAMLAAAGDDPRLGVCLDSCHVFAAGYDLRTQEAVEATLDAFDRAIGLARMKAVHLNDSKGVLGSRKDRHANLGAGEIGFEGLAALAHHGRLAGVPVILETPHEEDGHLRDLERLRAHGSFRT